MSLFQFLASDKILDEVDNTHVEFISINDAIERNIEIKKCFKYPECLLIAKYISN
jgi:hypothetical protein